MNRQEYQAYVHAFERGTEGMKFLSSGGCPGCEECGIPADSEEYFIEPHFSWSSCDICGSTLGGDREPAHYCDENNETIHLDVCVDCVYFMEYGQLDDMTMLDIERAD